MELPDGASLQPGRLTISFEDEQEPLERLFLLARVLATQPQMLSNLSLRGNVRLEMTFCTECVRSSDVAENPSHVSVHPIEVDLC